MAEDAFKGSSITKIILSNNIKTINEGAFNDCAFLTQIQ
ncbi:MAG: leucine-rich repeat domain-containing protein [Mycoplasmoidaceae bacterium]|nr:leucine-rich repeat domain-containing protein [Mycoplasmoidaceae bacterium]